MINKKWCDPRNISILSRSCSPHLEHLSIICRPFYLPREFSAVIATAVYIPPQADTSLALSKLHEELSGFINKHPDAASIIAGDFNKANLRKVMPTFHQHVSCPTRGPNTLDHCYTQFTTPCYTSKMAARTTDAAASLSPDRTVFSCFLSCKSQCFCTFSSRLPVFKRVYSREFLLDVGRTTFLELNSAHAEELRDLGLLRRPTPSPTPTTASHPQRRRYKRRERKQKRGKRGGIRARLAANPHKPAIPSIVLANVRSLDNKLDHIRLLRSTQRTVRDCCVFVFTETWLNNSVPDCAIQLEQLTCYRADRALVEGGKRRGGGALCLHK